MAIHPTAVIDASARFGSNVSVGPYTIIGPGVSIGDNGRIGPHVFIESNTTLGADCVIHKGASVGIQPQDSRFQGGETGLVIGNRAVLREYATVSRGSEGDTVIGDDFLLMSYGHISHDCRIGNGVVLSNSVIVMGGAVIGDWVVVGSLTFINRSVRIGELAFVGGGYRAIKDIPPFVIAADEPLQITGVNGVALEKKGFTAEKMENISKAFQMLHAGAADIPAALDKVRRETEQTPEIARIIDFVESSTRGVIP